MVLCINFITCIIWCCFWSRFRFFLCGFNGCFLGDNFDGGYGSNCHLLRICDTAEWSFFIDSISFFRISISFCNASFWLFLGCFAAVTLVGVFLLVLWPRHAFKIEFLTELFCSFFARFCLLNLHQRFLLLLLFNTAVYDGL